jgi:integration host factor alpha subunit
MTKLDIINKISEQTGLSRQEADNAVENIMTLIKDSLTRGDSVILRKFGSFQIREKNSRMGRNPKTGQEAEISARKVVRFKAGKHFKMAVNGTLDESSSED